MLPAASHHRAFSADRLSPFLDVVQILTANAFGEVVVDCQVVAFARGLPIPLVPTGRWAPFLTAPHHYSVRATTVIPHGLTG
ncbi:hypothetical protein SAMN02799620_05608 [Mycolicibacterium fluoranthenivorans]|uniref:Uncharacterized protein n=1 Tax=Mycolicibacterium fluoranthenivorans TaxID=258505 RepID=A0A1G4X0D9_9MYCO|nr:hypothetical protein SAMN02799620_05608 [Mycolicibacterium fluoranthenivorans]